MDVYEFINKAKEQMDQATGDYATESQRHFHTRNAVNLLITAIETMQMSNDAKPAPAPQPAAPVCPLCGETMLVEFEGGYKFTCQDEECDFGNLKLYVNKHAEALALFAKITGGAK